MATRTRLAGALSRGLLATALAGLMAGVAACGSVRAGLGGSPGTAAGSAAAPAGSAATSPGSAAVSATVPPATVPSATAPLCADAAHLDRMVVSPGAGFMPEHVRVAQPAGITITDPARVRAVAAALCGLPVMAATHMKCPVIDAGGYRLVFFDGARMFPPVIVETAGCRRQVSGLGPARQVPGSFLVLLRREIGPGDRVTPVPVPA